MSASHLAPLLLAVLLGTPTLANRPALVFPKHEDLFPAGSATFIEDVADLDRLAKTRPDDAAELRRILDALSHKVGDEATHVIQTRFMHVKAAMNPYIVLTSYPPKRDLTLVVNGNHYRLGLGISYDGSTLLAGYLSPPRLRLN